MKHLFLMSLILGGTSTLSHAQAPAFVTCSTESNGVLFSKAERDPSLARSLTSGACTNDARTNNEECNANLWCNNDSIIAPPMITCRTLSNNIPFSRASRDLSLSKKLTLASCVNDAHTNNEECNANITCDGIPTPRMITCKTDSNGIKFNHSDRDANLAKTLALSSCVNDSHTNNEECNSNLWCNLHGHYPARVNCSTLSNGIEFKHDGLSQTLTRAMTLSACTNNPHTNNDECSANIYCTP